MAIRILAAGVLATDVRTGREIPVNDDSDVATEERRARAAFDALDEDHGTRAQTAIRFVLSNADVSCAIVGLASLDHLDEALAGAAAGPLPGAALDRLESVYATGFERDR